MSFQRFLNESVTIPDKGVEPLVLQFDGKHVPSSLAKVVDKFVKEIELESLTKTDLFWLYDSTSLDYVSKNYEYVSEVTYNGARWHLFYWGG